MVDALPDNATALTITQDDVNDLDRAAVTRFHNIQIKRIMAGDRTLGDNRDTIEQAFARHRIETEQRLLPAAPGAVRIYVRWSDDGQHIRHWSREPFKHGLSEAQPVDAVRIERTPRYARFGADPYSWNNDDEGDGDGSGNPGVSMVATPFVPG